MKDKKKTPYLTRMSLIIRILASLYLLYTDYNLLSALTQIEGTEKLFMIIIIIVFGAIAAPMLIFSVKALINKDYVMPEEAGAETVEAEALEIEEAMVESEAVEEKDKDSN